MDNKRKKQLLGNLSEAQIIDFFPHPLAIFTPQYTIVVTNKAFVMETKMRVMCSEIGEIRILQHKINDIQLATAIKEVFAGNTFFLENLKNPFSMFIDITKQRLAEPDRFNRVLIFPVTSDDATITHGVIVFMP